MTTVYSAKLCKMCRDEVQVNMCRERCSTGRFSPNGRKIVLDFGGNFSNSDTNGVIMEKIE